MSGATFKRDDWLTFPKARYLTPLEAPARCLCRRIYIPDVPEFRAALAELVSRLGMPEIWIERPGGMTPQEAAWLGAEMSETLWGNDCMIGAIVPVTWAEMPDWALLCDGSSYDRVDYPDLYDRLDEAFIVDEDSFIVPDLRSRVVIGVGEGAGLTARDVAETGGTETVQLTEAEMPSHSHSDAGHTHIVSEAAPNLTTIGVGVPEPTAIPFPTVTGVGHANIQPTGGDEPHENMPPYMALKYAIIAR